MIICDIVLQIVIIIIRVLFSVFLEGQSRTFNVVSHQSNNIIPNQIVTSCKGIEFKCYKINPDAF